MLQNRVKHPHRIGCLQSRPPFYPFGIREPPMAEPPWMQKEGFATFCVCFLSLFCLFLLFWQREILMMSFFKEREGEREERDR